MSRGKSRKVKRTILPDIKYKNITISKFINKLMIGGNRQTVSKILYKALDIACDKLKKEPIEIFETALKNSTPLMEVRSRRIGGATYQVPMEVMSERGQTLAMRWMINSIRSKQGKTKAQFLAEEFIEAYQNSGSAVKKREELHKIAESNRAFAHFARF